MPAEVRAEEILITQGDRRYRVRGLAKNLSYDLLKINLLAFQCLTRNAPEWRAVPMSEEVSR